MDNKKLLIVGIDPGTTMGYAVLDIEGNLLHIASSKQLDLNMLISGVIKFGKVVLVGTDKAKVPNLVETFATKMGARIIKPQEDLRVYEKRKMTDKFNFNDEHQGDALASAILAYKDTKALLDKIDLFVKENKKQNINDRIKELVITKKISIKNAVSIIEAHDEESKIIEKVIADKKLSENDFLRLYNKLKNYETEIKLVKNYNNNLKNIINNLERNKLSKEDKKIIDFREKRLIFLDNQIKTKEREIGYLKSLLNKFNDILSRINDYYLLKKIDTLGLNEFNFKNKIINVQRNDMLLVDDPNIVSDSVIGFLKNRVFVIAHKKPVSKKIENSLPFIFISAKNLKIEEDKYFGFIEKKHFEAEKNKINWVNKVIEDYKKEKGQLISR